MFSISKKCWHVQYIQKVLATNPIALWVQDEKQGNVAYDMVSGRVVGAQNGTITGCTLGEPGIGDGRTSFFYDGVNDYTNIYSVALDAAFNGQEFTVIQWLEVFSAGVWTDGVLRYLLDMLVDLNNSIEIRKLAGNNQLQFVYKANAVVKAVTVNPFSETGWIMSALTASRTVDEMKAYLFWDGGASGGQQGATQNGLGAWVGNLAANFVTIGSRNVVPASVWNGSIGLCSLWREAKPMSVLEQLAAVQ